jgi:TonB family protein
LPLECFLFFIFKLFASRHASSRTSKKAASFSLAAPFIDSKGFTRSTNAYLPYHIQPIASSKIFNTRLPFREASGIHTLHRSPMRILRYSLALFLLSLISCLVVFAQNKVATAATAVAPPSAYPDSTGGLEQLLQEALTVARNGDDEKLASIVKDMEVPDCKAWLYRTYAPDSAESWLSLCDAKNDESMQGLLIDLAQKGGNIVTRSVNISPQPGKGMEWGMLQALKQPVDIYFAALETPEGPRPEPIGYFMFIDGAFRWDSNIRFVHINTRRGPPVPPQGMLKMVSPVYPPKAKAKGIEGTVKLQIAIRSDGSVKILHVISGDPLLVPAAKKAVSQWRYQPTIVNGRPVSIETTAQVTFSIYH